MKKVYSLIISLLMFLLFQNSVVFPQSFDIEQLEGNWRISQHQIKMFKDDINQINSETVIFSDIISGISILSVDNKGNFSFEKDQDIKSGFLELQHGRNLIFNYFSKTGGIAKQTTTPDPIDQVHRNNNKQSISSTIYQFTYSTGKLTITREDPLVKEMYIFIKQ